METDCSVQDVGQAHVTLLEAKQVTIGVSESRIART